MTYFPLCKKSLRLRIRFTCPIWTLNKTNTLDKLKVICKNLRHRPFYLTKVYINFLLINVVFKTTTCRLEIQGRIELIVSLQYSVVDNYWK